MQRLWIFYLKYNKKLRNFENLMLGIVVFIISEFTWDVQTVRCTDTCMCVLEGVDTKFAVKLARGQRCWGGSWPGRRASLPAGVRPLTAMMDASLPLPNVRCNIAPLWTGSYISRYLPCTETPLLPQDHMFLKLRTTYTSAKQKYFRNAIFLNLKMN